MKGFFATVFLGLVVLLRSASAADSPKLLWPGLTVEQFRKARPGVVPEKPSFRRQLEREGRFGGLSGHWFFHLADDELKEIRFTHRGEGVFSLGSKEAETMAALEAQRKVFEENLGKLRDLLNEALENPPVENKRISKNAPRLPHQSRTLFRASWKVKNLRVQLDLRFQGQSEYLPNSAVAEPLRHELSLTFSGRGLPGCVPGQAWHPGIPAVEFAKREPKLLPKGTAVTGQWGKNETLFGVPGQWAYNIHEGELNWYTFSRYWSEPDAVNEENFKKGLAAARALIKHYTRLLGKPSYRREKKTRFVDPGVEHHWGYDVIEARWKTPRGKLKVSFDFHGGKGEYFLLLKIGVFRPDYPYFD